jgi:hypothetical protein
MAKKRGDRQQGPPGAAVDPGRDVFIDKPSEGEHITIPYLAKGTISGIQGVTGVGYQIGSGAVHPVDAHTDTSWYRTLDSTDCPAAGGPYTLTIYVGNATTLEHSNPRHFYRN